MTLELPTERIEAQSAVELAQVLGQIARTIQRHRKKFEYKIAYPRQTWLGGMPEIFVVGTKLKEPLQYNTAGSNIQHATANYEDADLGIVADDWGKLQAVHINTRAHPDKLEKMIEAVNDAIVAARSNKEFLDRQERI